MPANEGMNRVGGGGAHREVPGVTEGGTWSRKDNKPSKNEPVFSRRGPDMCLVMQQSPHQTKLGLTEVIKQRSKGGKREERRSPPSFLLSSDGVIAEQETLFSIQRSRDKSAALTCSHRLAYKDNISNRGVLLLVVLLFVFSGEFRLHKQ